MGRRLCFEALSGIPEIRPGDALAPLIVGALAENGSALGSDSIVVVAQKIVSKSEGRFAWLDEVIPSDKARELAGITGKDARLVELTLSESTRVLRAVPGVLIVRHRLGYVMANAGIDMSNVPGEAGRERALLLPLDPDASAAALREALRLATGQAVGVIVSDSFGRPWRNGVTGVALGTAGIPSLHSLIGQPDLFGRPLRVSEIAVADELAAGASLVMGQADEGCPVVQVRGYVAKAAENSAQALIRPKHMDLFR